MTLSNADQAAAFAALVKALEDWEEANVEDLPDGAKPHARGTLMADRDRYVRADLAGCGCCSRRAPFVPSRPVSLVFSGWERDGKLVHDEAACEASMGDFYGGTTFAATVAWDDEQFEDLRAGIAAGLTPLFWVALPDARSAP